MNSIKTILFSIIAITFFVGCTFDTSGFDTSDENYYTTEFKRISCVSDDTGNTCETLDLPGEAYKCDVQMNGYMTPLKEGTGYVVIENGMDFNCPNKYMYDALYLLVAGHYTYDGRTLVVKRRSGSTRTFNVFHREDDIVISTYFLYDYTDHSLLNYYKMTLKKGTGDQCFNKRGRKMASCHAYYDCTGPVLLNCVSKMGCEAALVDFDVEGSWGNAKCENLPKD